MSSMIPASCPVVLASAASTAGVVLLWIVALLGSLLVILLLVPIHLRAEGGVDDESLDGRVRIQWAWGVLSVRVTPAGVATLHFFGLRFWTLRKRGPKDEADPAPKKERAKGQLRWFLKHRQTGLRFAKRLIRALRLQLQVRGELGLGDPASTALMNRLLWELNRTSPSVSFAVEPDWMEERVQLDGAIRARIWLAHIGLVLLGGLLNRETRQMLRTVPRAGRRGGQR